MEHFKKLADIHHFNAFPPPESPLFSIYRCERTCGLGDREFTSDFYMIGFKKLRAGTILYGRTKYDSDCGSMIFIKPRQVIEFKSVEYDDNAFIIFIHEDFLNGHFLHSEINKYGFFDYEANEALHLSPTEEKTMWDLYGKIETEYFNNTDEYSRDIILTHIDSILKYSQRFYKRQFISRKELSGKTVSKFNDVLGAYFKNGLEEGLPSVNVLAAQLNLSPRYLSDLLKKETGKTAIELIHIYLINEAKNRLKTDDQSVSEIAYALGFENLPYFSRLFKKETGISPNQYKKGLIN
ncbi:AraC family transcriptional regulator [Niastella yeongjuensis]|uniref:AraC family transcriptional regulator n=1 Tax=Niastella yeongjuensis TaxID=354355 RepID=A0A1V9EFW6_9BACT|nr:response regulator transcription factor [Niastella yeongjuensis]OQP45003.1 AraC family transcriptional regulator [Niastella yeongjuensis]SEP49116.1 Helix-turn-helix domain-containing protein [Niastella yeongjuensis]